MKKLIFALIAVSIYSLNAFAQDPPSTAPNFSSTTAASKASASTPKEKAMVDKLKSSYPNLQVKRVIHYPEVNLYEVRLENTQLPYFINEAIDFFVLGVEVTDPKTKKNLTAEADINNTKKVFAGLPFKESFSHKYGKGTRKVAVFSDPDCPFCKEMDKELFTNLKSDVTVYYFMNPLNIPGHEQSPEKAAKIWCSKNPSESWRKWMLEGVLPSNSPNCSNPVSKNKELARSLGFLSTPMIIFDNGFAVNRGISSAEMNTILAQRAP